MHELSLVESLVHRVEGDLNRMGSPRVRAVRIRRGSAFPEEALIRGWKFAVRGTPLAAAELFVDSVDVRIHCLCGYSQVVADTDLIGHMFVCPKCQHLVHVDEAHELAVVDLLVEDGDPPGAAS